MNGNTLLLSDFFFHFFYSGTIVVEFHGLFWSCFNPSCADCIMAPCNQHWRVQRSQRRGKIHLPFRYQNQGQSGSPFAKFVSQPGSGLEKTVANANLRKEASIVPFPGSMNYWLRGGGEEEVLINSYFLPPFSQWGHRKGKGKARLLSIAESFKCFTC